MTIIEDKIWVHYYKQRLYHFFRILRSTCYTSKSKPLTENSKNEIYKAINEFNKQLFFQCEYCLSHHDIVYKIQSNDDEFLYLNYKKWHGFKRMRRKLFPIGISLHFKIVPYVRERHRKF